MIDQLGDYIIQKQLGEGPFGTLFLAEHRFIKKLFLLQALPEEICSDSSFVRRFEMQIAEIAALDHPNIAKIHNVSFQEGRYFVVCDPIDGEEVQHLDRFLQLHGNTLSEEEIEAMLSQIASALDYAHGEKLFHGSLKPTNILVKRSAGELKVFLSHFGLTRMIGEKTTLLKLCQEIASAMGSSLHSSQRAQELHRHFLQNFAFLAPEQKGLDYLLVDSKADSYAFGVLAYYLLVQKLPEVQLDLPSKLAPELTLNWDLFLSRCLQNSPSMRPQNLTLALNEYLRAPRGLLSEMVHLEELPAKLESAHQMAFPFQEKPPQPVLKVSEIERPQFEPDPGAIFQREMQVSHYTPKLQAALEVEPLLTEMLIIPGGSYMRGGCDGARDEMPRHQISLASFAIDIHSVTNEQFVRFLQAMGGEKDHNNNDIIRLRDARIKRSGGKMIIESGYAKHPVVGVTWYGAIAYAKWIGKRLPTEAEWEAAATGGKADFLYPTGADIERSQANFFSSDTTAVMSYPPNGFGLYDMGGNVYEWCHDWYAYNYYEVSSLEPEAPRGPHQGVYRVLRGGCWKSLKEDMRCSHRHRNNPGAVNGTYGFRCAADVS